MNYAQETYYTLSKKEKGLFIINYKTHLAGGILIGVATVTPALEIMQIPSMPLSKIGAIYIASSVVGSLFPDLDHKGSYLSKKMKITSMIMSKLFKHRGVTHTPILLIIGTIFAYLISTLFYVGQTNLIIAMAFLMGTISHVLLDWLTKGGVPLLSPLIDKKYSLLKMSSGKIGEKVVFFLCIAFSSYIVGKGLDFNIF